MPDSIPQWVTDIESDGNTYKKKQSQSLTFMSGVLIAYVIIAFLLKYFNYELNMITYILIFLLIILLIILFITFFVLIGFQEPNRPNLLAANLYRIGAELEAFDATSPSYIKRNQQYLRNCQVILNDLIVDNEYFIKDYLKFLKNLENTILRLNYFYLTNSRPNNVSTGDLKALAEAIHENHENLKPVHTAYVDGILSNLQNVEPLALDIPRINRLYNSFNTGWYNISYFYRAAITLLVTGIIIFAASSILMIDFLSMGKSESYGYALLGTMTLIAGLITQIDKIVPREKIKLS